MFFQSCHTFNFFRRVPALVLRAPRTTSLENQRTNTGTPDEEDMEFISSDKARRFMGSLSFCEKVNWEHEFPKASEKALDLLSKMLVFNPARRITVIEALEHPYLATLHCEEDEPEADFKFDFGFDSKVSTPDEARSALLKSVSAAATARELEKQQRDSEEGQI